MSEEKTMHERALAIRTANGIVTREALQVLTEQRELLKEFVGKHMVEGTDYGVIPGTDKRTLLKPGAEKLVELFRCEPRFRLVEKTEDFDKGLFVYLFSVQLVQRDSGSVLAEGYGSANSREGRYRWRNATAKCPQCSRETLFRSKHDEGGFYCWGKKGGCGAKFGPEDERAKAAIGSAGKVENEDIATSANTILKIAKKRSLVDGAIAMARVSDLFTQDIEDEQDIEEMRMTPDAEEQAPALVEEYKQALTAEKDPRKRWRITQRIQESFDQRKLSRAHHDELVKFYKKLNAADGVTPGAAQP